MSITDLPDILTAREVQGYLRISNVTLRKWEKKSILIPIDINSRGDRSYRKSDIQKFIEEREER